jgi:hypothetical protein
MAEQSYDPVDLDAQKTAADDLRERLRLAREEQVSDIRWVMSSKRGRRLMARMLEIAPPFKTSFRRSNRGEGMVDALEMAFNEGTRNVGVQIYGELTGLCHELYLAMVKEQNDGSSNGNGKQHS